MTINIHCARMWKKEVGLMSFTMWFTPAVLLLAVLALVLLVRGIKIQSRWMLLCAGGIILLTGLCVFLVMEFITRPL